MHGAAARAPQRDVAEQRQHRPWRHTSAIEIHEAGAGLQPQPVFIVSLNRRATLMPGGERERDAGAVSFPSDASSEHQPLIVVRHEFNAVTEVANLVFQE